MQNLESRIQEPNNFGFRNADFEFNEAQCKELGVRIQNPVEKHSNRGPVKFCFLRRVSVSPSHRVGSWCLVPGV